MNTQTVHSKHLSKKGGKFILHYRPGTGYIKVIKRDPQHNPRPLTASP